MPAPLAPLLGFSLGVAFAWAAREDLTPGAGGRILTRSFAFVLGFALLVFLPASGYFLVFEPAWSYLYTVEGARRFAALNFVALGATISSVPLGFLIAVPHARTRRAASLVRLAAVPLVLALTVALVGGKRLAVRATYAQFHGDFGVERLAGSSLGWAVMWSVLVTSAAAVYTAHSIRRLGRAE